MKMMYDQEEVRRQRQKQNEPETKPDKGKIPPKAKLVLMMVAILVVGVTAGYFMHGNLSGSNALDNGELSRFKSVYETIESQWVNTTDNPDLDLETAAIEGFLNNLGDPHTNYFTIEGAQAFTDSMSGSYAGIGVAYRPLSSGALVTEVYGESPSAGILEMGDIIVAAEGHSLEGLTSEEMANLIRGEAGTEITLTIKREGKTMDVVITRQNLDSSVSYSVDEVDGVTFGYMKITTFGDTTAETVKEGLESFKNQGIEQIVLDLRSNGGGYLTAVRDMLSYFIPEGELLFTLEEKSGPALKYTSDDSEKYTFRAGYVLVDSQTASASEVMAGCLQQKLGYQLVGTTTYGKGTAQTQRVLTDMSSYKYTYAKWNLPDGTNINGVGLTPDIAVESAHLYDFMTFELSSPLQYDSVSTEVAYMQMMLNTIGYDCGREDGYFSQETETALRQFESDQGLSVDGAFSQEDNEILQAALVLYLNNKNNDVVYQAAVEEMK